MVNVSTHTVPMSCIEFKNFIVMIILIGYSDISFLYSFTNFTSPVLRGNIFYWNHNLSCEASEIFF